MLLQKQLKGFLIVTSILLAAGLAVGYPLLARTNLDLYIKTIEIDFPAYEPDLSSYGVTFRMYTTIEIWNPNNHGVEIGTGGTNLFDPQLDVEWINEQYNYSFTYFTFQMCTIHEIPSGITYSGSYGDFFIYNYSQTVLPYGDYIVTNYINGYYEYEIHVYNTTLTIDNNQTLTTIQDTPMDWGNIVYFPLDWKTSCLIAVTILDIGLITILIYNQYKKRKKVNQ